MRNDSERPIRVHSKDASIEKWLTEELRGEKERVGRMREHGPKGPSRLVYAELRYSAPAELTETGATASLQSINKLEAWRE